MKLTFYDSFLLRNEVASMGLNQDDGYDKAMRILRLAVKIGPGLWRFQTGLYAHLKIILPCQSQKTLQAA